MASPSRFMAMEPWEMSSDSKAIFKRAVPYADDAMNLPVADVDAVIPYYEKTFGFRVVSRHEAPHKSVVLARDEIQIGLAENGGDPEQEVCYFEVDNVEAAFAEIKIKERNQATMIFRQTGMAIQRQEFSL